MGRHRGIHGDPLAFASMRVAVANAAGDTGVDKVLDGRRSGQRHRLVLWPSLGAVVVNGRKFSLPSAPTAPTGPLGTLLSENVQKVVGDGFNRGNMLAVLQNNADSFWGDNPEERT